QQREANAVRMGSRIAIILMAADPVVKIDRDARRGSAGLGQVKRNAGIRAADTGERQAIVVRGTGWSVVEDETGAASIGILGVGRVVRPAAECGHGWLSLCRQSKKTQAAHDAKPSHKTHQTPP